MRALASPGSAIRRALVQGGTAALMAAAVVPSAAAAPDPVASSKLPELPRAPNTDLPRPDPAAVDELEQLLTRLRSGDADGRRAAAAELLEVRPALLPAIHHRLRVLGDKSDKEAMKALLSDLRSDARNDVRAAMEAEGKRGEVKTPDYLRVAVDDARPSNKAWQDLVSVLGLSRMLVAIGSIGAARELINVYVRFGEFLRVDTQLQLEKLGDRAVAALIEARRHQAEKIARWAERQLDALGKAIPSEAVQIEDHEVLADILRAYGRVKDPDAARIIISFASSERAQLRDAARQAISLMGEVSHWQLREAYEQTTGKRPPRDWGWDRTARQLFAELDRARQAQVYRLFDEGMRARSSGDLERMRQNFDKVLARSPSFEQPDDMAAGYLAYARAHADDKPELALLALRRAERLFTSEQQRNVAKSLRLTLQGEQLLDRGVADQAVLRRATELDAANQRAADTLGRVERGETQARAPVARYAAASAIGAVALLAIGLIALRRPKRGEVEPSTSIPEPPNKQPPTAASESAADADSDAPNDGR
jgi:hypothetical protein